MRNKYSFIIVIIFFIGGFFLINQPSPNSNLDKPQNGPQDIKYVKIGGTSVKVDLALTREEQAEGLSGRNGLKENEGMLFIFETPDTYNFWMKDMNFAIDMIWLNEGKEIIYIKKDARPESYPAVYGPEENAKYVLEVASGFSEKNNLKVGDTALFTY
jgi:uncharacterized membrane protein (UPF0127 family)